MNVKRGLMLTGAIFALCVSGFAAAKSDCAATGVGLGGTNPPGQNKPDCSNPQIMANPEIDGAGALAAIALLGGVLTLVGERRRRKN